VDDPSLYRVLADALRLLHAGFVVFVVGGLVLVLVGGGAGWAWVRNRAFRWAHLAAIGVVVAQSWLGMVCPLTRWENDLRRAAGEAGYESGFVAHWVGRVLYWDLPGWVFIVLYTAFFALVILSWWWVPPRRAPIKAR
jgi:hypothetical protein